MSQKTPDEPVVLTEYDSALIKLDANQVRLLRRLTRGAVTLQLDDMASTWSLTSSHYVGTIVTPGVRILITPKVDTANLFYLLEASGKPVDIGPAVFDYDTTRDLISSFATFYARHLEKALGHGVPRTYQETQERLLGIRGRVDLPAQPPCWAAHPRRMPLRRVHGRHQADPGAPRRGPAPATPPRRDGADQAGAATPRRHARRSGPVHARGHPRPDGLHQARRALPAS